MEDIAITGIGLISPAGIGPSAVLDAMCEGRTFFESKHGDRTAHKKFPWPEASLKTPDMPWPVGPGWVDLKKYANTTAHQAVAVAQLAMEHAELKPGQFDARLSGAIVASGIRTDDLMPILGRIGEMAANDKRPLARLLYEEVPDFSYLKDIPSQVGQFVCLATGFRGSNLAMYGEAGVGGIGSLALAMRLINSGELERVMVVGVAAPLPVAHLVAMDEKDALGSEASADKGPFAADRAGTLPGHAAVAIVIEAATAAARRGAPMIARLSACETVNASNVHTALASAFTLVTGAADCRPDAWWAHGAGSRALDLAECNALGEALQVPVTGSKGTIGNPFEVSGLIDVALAAEGLRRGQLPPVGLLNKIDRELDHLDIVVGHQRQLDNARQVVISTIDHRVEAAGITLIDRHGGWTHG